MKFALFQVLESFWFAAKTLRENLLRTTLSLLGVTVGIFAIIGILTFVDAIERGIRDSLSFLGDNVVYVQKWPWSFEAGYPWWKYMNRPDPKTEEFRFLNDKLSHASAVSVFDVRSGITTKYKSNSISNTPVMGVSHSHNEVSDLSVAKGRYFTPSETDAGVQVVLVGSTVANTLFQGGDGIGQEISLRGRKFRVIGRLKEQGENLLGTPSNDNLCVIPYNALQKMYGKFNLRPTISIKGYKDDKNLEKLEGEIKGLLRGYRGLRPKQEDNFAINRPELFASFIDGIIAVLTLAGSIIGSFSILVGGFGIANIMFVSVKERTSQIGLQKSLGARNYVILFQFLFEAIFLSIIGGVAGLLLVSLLGFVSSDTFVVRLTVGNIFIGLGVSTLIGVASGLLPALSASKLDPVEAMRQGM